MNQKYVQGGWGRGKKGVKSSVAGFTWLLNCTTYKVCFQR